MPLVSLIESLRAHAPADPEERDDLQEILAFVAAHDNPFDRAIPSGHLTGSAIVLSADFSQVLLLFHPKLTRWLQPGGHAEAGERTGEHVALREAREETGIHGLSLHPQAPRPLDVDVHDIPARPTEPAHQHLDLRYLVQAPAGARIAPAEGETLRIRWFGWNELDDLGLDHGLKRALRKARSLAGPTPRP
jgi:8-oxo-dGTP pyrophosphatase MutT (NUDIX family)